MCTSHASRTHLARISHASRTHLARISGEQPRASLAHRAHVAGLPAERRLPARVRVPLQLPRIAPAARTLVDTPPPDRGLTPAYMGLSLGLHVCGSPAALRPQALKTQISFFIRSNQQETLQHRGVCGGRALQPQLLAQRVAEHVLVTCITDYVGGSAHVSEQAVFV